MNVKPFACLSFFLLLVSCAPVDQDLAMDHALAYIPSDDNTLLSQWAPVFIVENPEKTYNKIGSPVAGDDGEGGIVVDPDISSVYVEERSFVTAGGTYRNLIYRIHFPEIPHGLVPFQIGAGKNIGLLVIVTMNSSGQPVLYTTVHTCGCYLAFFPTSFTPADTFPEGWPSGSQSVYGENLPTVLDFTEFAADNKIMLLLRNRSHRVRDIWGGSRDSLGRMEAVPLPLRSASLLERLPVDAGNTVSFYEESGSRQGYVKGSHKYWERLLMSWWVLDWRIGEDKKLGRDKNDLPVFYTSLKPWARDESDMRDFSAFLTYWGWNL
jgi:hypothetical protein